MPRCGTTFDENIVPPWTRGDFRGGVEQGNKPTPALRDRCRSAPPLPRRGFSGELEAKTRNERMGNKTSQENMGSLDLMVSSVA
jgi:hypothetical protein